MSKQLKPDDGHFQDESIVVYGGGGAWGKHIVNAATGSFRAVNVVEQESPTADVLAAAGNDVLFFATPDPTINQLLIDVRHRLTSNQAIIDCGTSKVGYAATLKEIAQDGVSVCSTHPMVAPNSSLLEEPAIIMPMGENDQHAKTCAELLYTKMGMRLEELAFDQHADYMNILQMNPHLARMLIHSLAQGLNAKGMSMRDVSRVAPANFRMAELGLGRVAGQKPEVSAGIIIAAMQSYLGNKILDSIQEMLNQIRAAKKPEDLASLFGEDVMSLDPDGSWRAQMKARTDAVLAHLKNPPQPTTSPISSPLHP